MICTSIFIVENGDMNTITDQSNLLTKYELLS